MSKLFLAQKSSQLNGNTFYHFLVAGFTFMMLTPLGTSFLCLDILNKCPKKEIIFHLYKMLYISKTKDIFNKGKTQFVFFYNFD